MLAIAWLLNAAYAAILLAAFPLLLFRSIVLGKYRTGWAQKLCGNVPEQPAGSPCLWLHAVSVGEVLQLQPVLSALAARQPDCRFVISTTTVTGQEVARQRYPQHTVIYYPLDFSWSVSRALDRIRPTAIILVELELWPNFIFSAARRRIPVLLINGRISDRSFRGYCRIRPLMAALLRRLTLCAVQNETYGARLRHLGARAHDLHVTGSIKFDRVETDRSNPATSGLRRLFGLAEGDVVFVAGSTQAPEEKYAIESYLALRGKYPRLRLLLVPRHRERFEEVARLVQDAFGLPLLRRSSVAGQGAASGADPAPSPSTSVPPVLLLDTLGELSACWGLADVAFVGGSLTQRGGQNMIEPAGYGAAVLFGPNTQNFRDVVDALLIEDAARVVHDAAGLTRQLDEFLTQPILARACGVRARNLVLRQRGATQQTVGLIVQALDSRSNGQSRAA